MDGGRLTAVVSDPPPLSNFPADMLLEILKRLPAKTLMKLKCVSKYWLNLIRDSSFAESHLNHARTHRSDASQLLLACFLRFSVERIKTIFPATNEDLCLSAQLPSHTFGEDFQPCSNVVNGLVCVCLVVFSRHLHPCIWVPNLTTTEKKALPVPPSLELAAKPTTNLHRSSRFYLGFDPVSKKYKILHYHCEVGAYEVLTLGSETWRQVRGSAATDVDLGLGKIREGFIFQGFGHGGMASINGRIYFRYVAERVITFFHLKEEKFGQVAIPQRIEGITFNTDIVDLGGKLSLVVGIYELVSQLRIWISEDDNNNVNWVEKRLTLPDLYYVETMGVTGNGKLILNCKDIPCPRIPTYFFCYDLKTFELITAIKMQPYRDPLLYNFVENIVPLDRIGYDN
ncbi:PREDICTED: putative F-box protein At4g21240 [Ipomoea nil]|uniref:putative F-box protein At4g21240 n=1 Tax=Ipomoea nil TaxID=35883 RepID=UPI0009013069|nr:PREDICTED: putative F-box protein At4g21240 [Ipomoea nil]